MATQKRKAIPQKARQEVFKKYGGKCAYCGKVLSPKGWQLDHLIPVQREKWGKATEREGRFAALLFFVSRETSICFNAKSRTKGVHPL